MAWPCTGSCRVLRPCQAPQQASAAGGKCHTELPCLVASIARPLHWKTPIIYRPSAVTPCLGPSTADCNDRQSALQAFTKCAPPKSYSNRFVKILANTDYAFQPKR